MLILATQLNKKYDAAAKATPTHQGTPAATSKSLTSGDSCFAICTRYQIAGAGEEYKVRAG